MQSIGTRILSILLSVGGVLGIGIALFSAATMAKQHWLYGAMMVLFAVLFAYATYAGIQLWRNRSGSLKRALILFLTQVPVFTFPGITYEWYTGLSYKLMGGQVVKSSILGLGSSFNFFLDVGITDTAYGVNVIAILAAAFLYLARPDPSIESTSPGKPGAASHVKR